jgi:hypothetical protein
MQLIRPMTPLRQRMPEDMQMRHLSPHTIDGYLRYVAQFAKYFNTSPDRLGPEHIRLSTPSPQPEGGREPLEPDHVRLAISL